MNNPFGFGASRRDAELGGPQSIHQGGWSKQGTMALDDPKPTQEVSLQADIPGPASDFTVQFAISAPPAGSTWNRIVQAEINWTVEGVTIKRLVSVVNGQSITGVGKYVRVRVTDHSQFNPAGGSLPETYTVRIIVAPGTRGSSGQPPLLYPLIAETALSLGPAGTVNIPLDVDAGASQVNVGVFSNTNTPIPAMQVEVRQLAGTVVVRRDDPRAMEWIPLASGCTSITLINATGADTVQFSLVFGIDG